MYMDTVRQFLSEKNGGIVPPEWQVSLELLETYYKEFLMLDEEINNLPSLVVIGRYGAVPSPLIACRDKAATKLQQIMSEMALTFKSNVKLDLSEPTQKETSLNKFLKDKIEKRSIR